jgi:exopolyphosphatase / guanosine-5'-triphosphate,3'-diphosphate pyrophosphatase
MKINKVAAIDIGSNAVRLLISRLKEQPEGITLKKELMVRIPLRLGEDSFETGEISKQRANRLLKVMKSFQYLMQVYQVDVYRAYATAAMREAKNDEKIIQKIKDKAKINLKLISGAEEARVIYESHAADQLQQDKNYLYVDVGGGSTEITLIVCGGLADSRSFNIGTIRMLRGKVAKTEREEMIAYLSEIKSNFAPVEIIGSGGNINKLYRLAKTAKNKPLTTKKLQELYQKLIQLSVEERMTIFDLNPDRADVIVPACELFLEVAEVTGISEIFVPTIGLVDGIAHSIVEKIQKQEKEAEEAARLKNNQKKHKKSSTVVEKLEGGMEKDELLDLEDENSSDD